MNEFTREEITKAEEKYTAEMETVLIGMGATIDKNTPLETRTLAASMEHDNLDVVFAVPLYRVVNKIPLVDKFIVKNFGVFYDPDNTRRYKKISAYAWLDYVIAE